MVETTATKEVVTVYGEITEVSGTPTGGWHYGWQASVGYFFKGRPLGGVVATIAEADALLRAEVPAGAKLVTQIVTKTEIGRRQLRNEGLRR